MNSRPKPRQPVPYTREAIADIRRMADLGMSVDAISLATGWDKLRLATTCRKHEISIAKEKQPAATANEN